MIRTQDSSASDRILVLVTNLETPAVCNNMTPGVCHCASYDYQSYLEESLFSSEKQETQQMLENKTFKLSNNSRFDSLPCLYSLVVSLTIPEIALDQGVDSKQ